ncbi:hypothetical protein [Bacillus phage BM-P1]|nr:hypothetical protein BSP12_128 [Bacillus phage BSP12]UJJ74673.1 hypothetical protein [Bacillus phage BM-P1]
MKMKISLPPEEVQQIIKDYLQTKFNVVGEVSLELDQEIRGYGSSEYYQGVFKGATCEVEVSK